MFSFKANFLSCFMVVLSILGNTLSGTAQHTSRQMNIISADNAANAAEPLFTAIQPLILTESRGLVFSTRKGTNQVYELRCPEGWHFKAAVGTVSYSKTSDLTPVKFLVAGDRIIIGFKVTGTRVKDEIRINGIQVQHKNGAIGGAAGNISLYRKSQLQMHVAMLVQEPGKASKLAFTQRPGYGTANVQLDQPIVISSLDQFGNVTSNGLRENETVKLKLFAGSGKLLGTVSANIGTAGSCGTASFESVIVNSAGAKKLAATCSSLTLAITPEFNIEEEDNATRVEADLNPDWVCYADVSRFSTP